MVGRWVGGSVGWRLATCSLYLQFLLPTSSLTLTLQGLAVAVWLSTLRGPRTLGQVPAVGALPANLILRSPRTTCEAREASPNPRNSEAVRPAPALPPNGSGLASPASAGPRGGERIHW